mmetsp:Transcript_29584/g.40856  ORF Transcript_29584/g.40856 Transcript_29584/m.40856 type:complete len:95 (+) Transcript_29584:409-693(+)
MRSQFGRLSSIPRMIAPQSSESSCDVFGEVSFTGKPLPQTPSEITLRQSEWISPDRYTFHIRGAEIELSIRKPVEVPLKVVVLNKKLIFVWKLC